MVQIKRQRKKILQGLTGIVLSMSLSLAVVGCGDLSDHGTPAKSPVTAKPEVSEQRIEITWANNFNAPEADDNYVHKQLEQKLTTTAGVLFKLLRQLPAGGMMNCCRSARPNPGAL
ncbi:hypothetical protein KZ483_07330 [Paenibacillus sp. sptzw28]|uniref:hypothetical protein n=1 Tax=Paenibacillus sp. sptzw28 TaxID=715179 RepID=UPI001C6E1B4F|nr:hypothetical protein [Paenibacillus sp. sptzw28]QYR22748.1 hypothetical protein KZ483_07330 [Paenibacillus sp. sptzw28]